ncbi:MAG: GNAT family N-acetyltransferase [Candidatus Kerfeldbacteria bacterium]|nr:GNAT family N-acetyltransferase [Candidatus Kerfeldbacteria bacterium]
MNQYQGKLEGAAREVLNWLMANSTQFREYLHEYGQLEAVLKRFELAATTPGHERDQYLFFTAAAGGSVIAAGYFETNGDCILLQWIGLCDEHRRHGIGRKLLAWYLGSLPASTINAVIAAGVTADNTAMRNWCAQFGAEEQLAPDGSTVIETFLVADAGAELESPPGSLHPPFPREWEGLTFRLLYLGRNPRHFQHYELPTCE